MGPTKLKEIFPLCVDPEGWAAALEPAMARYDITLRPRIANFLAQIGYESSQLNRLVENLTYSTAARLMKVWPKRFPGEASSIPYLHNEVALANFVYAGRLGNGVADSGDGYRYRGRGVIQITGRDNYESVGKALNLDLLGHPDLLLEKEHAAMSAAWFWSTRGLNTLADRSNDDDVEHFKEITRRINGGTEGLEKRLALLTSIERQLA
jgi:putative chitinase